MRRILHQLLFLFLLSASAMVAQTANADQLLSDAKVKAAAQHKAILVVFGASWCPDCQIYDRFFARPEMNAVIEKYFVFRTPERLRRGWPHPAAKQPRR